MKALKDIHVNYIDENEIERLTKVRILKRFISFETA